MAFEAKVFRILIASPSDVEDEREIAVRVIQEWNDLHSYTKRIVLLPLRWETHTAPDYGTRPQEVINRAIVDDCDLLVGIFWTRLGTPSGAADSGTLEEIERVGSAGKPIMLYFSRVEIDPEMIDVRQIERLKAFKKSVYPIGLVENYQKIMDFRDKFSKQLEMKVRDLQAAEASGVIPLNVSLLSTETGQPAGNNLHIAYVRPIISDYSEVPDERRELMRDIAERRLKEASYVPMVIGMENSGNTGMRNLFCEFEFVADNNNASLFETITHSGEDSTYDLMLTTPPFSRRAVAVQKLVERTFERYEAGHLQKTEVGWKLAIELEALQPQRLKVIKPFLFVDAPTSTKFTVHARVFSDSFSAPLSFDASMHIEVTEDPLPLSQLIPNWKELLNNKPNRLMHYSKWNDWLNSPVSLDGP